MIYVIQLRHLLSSFVKNENEILVDALFRVLANRTFGVVCSGLLVCYFVWACTGAILLPSMYVPPVGCYVQ